MATNVGSGLNTVTGEVTVTGNTSAFQLTPATLSAVNSTATLTVGAGKEWLIFGFHHQIANQNASLATTSTSTLNFNGVAASIMRLGIIANTAPVANNRDFGDNYIKLTAGQTVTLVADQYVYSEAGITYYERSV
jgi:hypothetical protein